MKSIENPFDYITVVRIKGFMHTREVKKLYVLSLNAIEGPVVELGCFMGRSSCALGAGVMNSKRPNSPFICIDTFEGVRKTGYNLSPGVLQRKFEKNMRAIPHETRVQKSWESGFMPDNTVALCFIDADHSYESVVKDINAWWPKIKEGGILCGHDYKESKFGVKQAVDNIFGGKHEIIMHTIWSVKKCSATV